MKKIVILLNLLLLISACKEESTEVFPKEAILKVNYYQDQCTGVFPQTCLLVQWNPQVATNQWEYFYDQIEGFNYEAGFIYTLKVRIDPVVNPPADASARKYLLLEVLSKERA